MADLREIDDLVAAHATMWVGLEAASEATDNVSDPDVRAAAEDSTRADG